MEATAYHAIGGVLRPHHDTIPCQQTTVKDGDYGFLYQPDAIWDRKTCSMAPVRELVLIEAR